MRKKVIALIGALLLPTIMIVVIIVAVTSVMNVSAISGGAANGTTGGNGGNGTLSAAVLSYQDKVQAACGKYGIPDYVMLVLAVMQQESGGTGNDPMQCSECPLNIKYTQSPNGITDSSYSIEIGIEYLASCIRAAGCKSSTDEAGIGLALQGYNYGGGYIDWAKEHGGYSAENAMQFSQMEAASHGWSGYGDPQYVSHVLRYYTIAPNGGLFAAPLKAQTYSISRGWGYDDGEFHKGIDFAAPAGTNIYAAAAGTVTYAQFGSAPYGGYGNVVVIKHDDTYSSLYGHCSKLLVNVGQSVKQGQVIALVGSTGDSTGNHCHFEIRMNRQQVNPAQYLGITVK